MSGVYTIKPESVKTFIEDRGIELPRFQRKQTWDEKKNFQLCISIFKNYPIGVCIINREDGIKKGSTKKYLLDGRQRRNALSLMYENPEYICMWGRKFLGLKNSMDDNALRETFDEKINEYLQAEDGESLDALQQSYEEQDVELDDLDEQNSSGFADAISGFYGIDLLFQIIKICYKDYKHFSGFTSPYDFEKWIKSLPYVDLDSKNVYRLNGKKLKDFLREYRTHCDNNDIDYMQDQNDFIDYTISRGNIDVPQNKSEAEIKDKIKQTINGRWQELQLRAGIIDKIEEIISESQIGLIEVQGFSPSDSQKIFGIINQEGVKLTAVEILSAKTYWNRRINNPYQEMQDAVSSLYKAMGINVEGVYRWDIPATLLSRLGETIAFKELSWNEKTEFEKKLTIGFKLFAGLYQNGITKESIDDLGKNQTINWDTEAETVLQDFKSMFNIINGIPYFNFLKSWRATIMDLTSDAVAINFALIMLKDWRRKNKPTGSSVQTEKFQKNCFILWDRSIYEYICLQWRGSSDSKIANNIKKLDEDIDANGIFEPVPSENWKKILEEIFESFTINGNSITQQLMKPLLYHMYCMRGISGPDTKYDIEVDHIIPQTVFEKTTFQNKKVIKDSLFNLGLLPKNENISKSNELLKNIDDSWLISEVEKYEFIQKADFEKYSNVNNYHEMFKERKVIFDKIYGSIRDDLLNQ